ncbi:DUF4138 domain-containing protein [Echinicola rosea]|uniref:Conjugative transposon protein TraN n=1 Tax=Echinicola rosea TaxID=1807691 RepID=A0ABQ1V925_9BACT|nr:DUF4138 domain-containing protein [Echinicola rosea]GGF44093.1 hypothetical protein GCM10011339_35720 [Echinicola rosea]
MKTMLFQKAAPSLLLLFLSVSILRAQYAPKAIIKSYPVEVAYDKTTVLVFPFEVKSLDRGNPVVMAQKDGHAGNVLKLKAAAKGFAPTSLHVITSGGRLYHFKVSYRDRPSPLTIDMAAQLDNERFAVALKSIGLNQRELANYAALIVNKKPRRRLGRKARSGKVSARVRTASCHGQTLFFTIDLKNKGAVDFLQPGIRCWKRDGGGLKRTARRNTELVPVHASWKAEEGVKGDASNRLVLALPQFSLRGNENLVIDIREQNGGRLLRLRLKAAHLEKAEPIIQP